MAANLGARRLRGHRLEPDARPGRRARQDLGVAMAADRGRGRRRRRHRRHRASRTRRTSRPCCSARTASSTAPDPARSSSTCSTIAPSGSWDFAARLGERGLRDGRRPRLGRQRGRPEGDPDDLRRRRRRRRRACPAGPRSAWARPSPTSARSAPARRSRPSTRSSSPAPTSASPRGSSSRSRPASTSSRSSARSAAARPSRWVLANRSGRMLDNDYPLGFKVALHRKDLGIALDLAGELGAALPLTRAGRAARDRADRRRPRATRTCRSIARTIRGLSGLEG